MRATIGLLGAVVWLTLMAAPAWAQTRSADVPLSAWARLPAVDDVEVSDDGSAIAYIRRVEGRSEVVAQTRAGEVLAVVDVSDRRVSGLEWLSPDHVGIRSLVLESRLTIGTSHLPQLDIVNVRTRGVARALGSADRSVINAVFDVTRGTSGGRPIIYVEAITSEGAYWNRDVYRVDLDNGRGRRVATGQRDTAGFMIRPDGEVAARIARSDDATRFRLTSPDGTGGWRTVYETVSLLDGPGVWGFGRDPDHAMISVTEGDAVYLTEVDLKTGELGEKQRMADAPTGAIYDRNGRLVAMATYGEEQSYSFFEPQLEAAWSVMRRGLADRRLAIGSFSADYQSSIFYSEGAADAGTWFLYDAASRSVSVVGRAYPEVPVDAIAPILLIDYAAADGMQLKGYLTLPPGRDASNLPLVVFPHGGPASRDYLAFDWWAQAMASRGYAVFQPQFRGSDGFGEAYLRAGYGEWGRKMQTDVSDGVKFLAEQGVVDLKRTCIVGASYGGYAVLQGMATEPDLYRCGVSVAGVADLPEMLKAEARDSGYQNESRNPVIRYWNRFMGAEGRRDESLIDLSPSRRATAFQGPVLLIHGRDDTVVPLAQSEIMHRALLAAGKSSKLVVLDGEDHWLSFAPTRLRLLEETVAFLIEHNPPD